MMRLMVISSPGIPKRKKNQNKHIISSQMVFKWCFILVQSVKETSLNQFQISKLENPKHLPK